MTDKSRPVMLNNGMSEDTWFKRQEVPYKSYEPFNNNIFTVTVVSIVQRWH